MFFTKGNNHLDFDSFNKRPLNAPGTPLGPTLANMKLTKKRWQQRQGFHGKQCQTMLYAFLA